MRSLIPKTALALLLLSVFAAVFPKTLDQTPKLSVLCSNNLRSCKALAERYEKQTEIKANIFRLPTSAALAKLEHGSRIPEFDVWIGGPAEAYVTAADKGLLVPHGLTSHTIPKKFQDPYWIGTYGGILAFCSSSAVRAPQNWNDLTDRRYRRKIILPSPLSSGTAGTMVSALGNRFPGRQFVSYFRRLHKNTAKYIFSGTHLAQLIENGRADVAVTFAPYCQSRNAKTNPGGPTLRTTYPADGTAYEIGAAALLKGGKEKMGRDFLRFVISDGAQDLVSSIERQNPTSVKLPQNLASKLDSLQVPILVRKPNISVERREYFVKKFADAVYAPAPGAVLLQTAAVSVPAALAATILGAILGLGARFAKYRRTVGILLCLPLSVPSAAWATALFHVFPGLTPYSDSLLRLTLTVSSVPIALLVHLLCFSQVSDTQIVAFAGLGHSPKETFRTLFLPRFAPAFPLSLSACLIWAAADSSANSAFGSAAARIANIIFSPLPGSLGVTRTVLLCVIAAIGIYAVGINRVFPHITTEIALSPHRSGTGSYFSALRRALSVFCAAWILCLFLLYLIALAGLASDLHTEIARELIRRLFHSLTVAVSVAPVSVLLGFALAVKRLRHRKTVNAFFVAVLLIGFTFGGPIFSNLYYYRHESAFIPTFLRYLGADWAVRGILGVCFAYLLLTLPISYFGCLFFRRGVRTYTAVTENLGAPRLRVFFLAVHEMRAPLLAVSSMIGAIIVTQTAPGISLQPAQWQLIAPTVVSFADSGMDCAVLFAGCLSAGCAQFILGIGIMAVNSVFLRKLHGYRTE